MSAPDPRTNEELVAASLEGDLDDHAPWEAVLELQRRGTPAALELALGLLRSDSAEKRSRGADVLAQLGGSHRPFRNESLDALEAAIRGETSPRALYSMALAFHHLHDARAVSALLPFVAHPEAQVRYGVVFGLTGHSDTRAVEALIQLSGDEDEDVRNWATFGLGTQIEDVDTPSLREALLKRLDDANAEVRGEALMGLALRKDLRVLEPLVKELSGRKVIILAVEAAGAIGDTRLLPKLLPLLVQLRDSPGTADEHFRTVLNQTIETLEEMGREE